MWNMIDSLWEPDKLTDEDWSDLGGGIKVSLLRQILKLVTTRPLEVSLRTVIRLRQQIWIRS